MNTESPAPKKRWRYVKRCSDQTGEITSIYRTRGFDIEVLRDGRWTPADYRSWFHVREDPDYEWLTRQETSNLLNFLRTGQEGLPRRLDLQPTERYKKWKCPDCQTFTVVPIVIGLPGAEDMEAEAEGHIILQGCIVYGDEPDQPIACTQCGWFGEALRGKRVRQLSAPRAFQEPERSGTDHLDAPSVSSRRSKGR